MESLYECLSVLAKKGRVSHNNLRLAFHLDDEQIDELISSRLIKCVHSKQDWLDDDCYEIDDLGRQFLEENRK